MSKSTDFHRLSGNPHPVAAQFAGSPEQAVSESEISAIGCAIGGRREFGCSSGSSLKTGGDGGIRTLDTPLERITV
jgi:hypothetical protein